MSPATNQRAHWTDGSDGSGRDVLWCAGSTGQVDAALAPLRHLLPHHRVTLAVPAPVWEEVLDGEDGRAAGLVEAGLEVLHPAPVRGPGARSLLHSLHRPDDDSDLHTALLDDPRVAALAAEAIVLWPGTTRSLTLDDARITTGQEAREAVAALAADGLASTAAKPREVLAVDEAVPGAVTPQQRVRALTALVNDGSWDGGVRPLRRALTDMARPDLDEAELLTLLGLTFARPLHADAVRTPLVERPGRWLRPLRTVRAWQRLTREHPRPTVPRAISSSSPHIVLLPGTYGRFEGPVVSALEAAGCTVDVLDLAELAPGLLRRTVSAENLAAVRSLVEHGEHGLPPEAVERLAAADLVWAEWADLPAVWASHLVAPHQRMVLRLHSLDALDPWIHLVRWASVDALVAVGAPAARVALAALGPRTDLPPVHVIGHVLDDHWTRVPATGDAHRRLVMVKWGRRVKDPLLALELLARLRAHDPAWRLRLVGDHLSDAGERGPYAERFARRAAQEDVAGAVEYVPHTDDVAGQLEGCGFVLSTSRRESFHLGLVEAAAAGCVPVVRDWPAFARRGGARDVMPAEWVVAPEVTDEDGTASTAPAPTAPGAPSSPDSLVAATLDAAVERVLAHSERAAWEEASARTREQVREHFPAHEAVRRLTEVALNRKDPRP